MEQLQSRLTRVQKAKRNAIDREKRVKTKCADLLEELKEKNFLTAELEDKLSCYQGLLNSKCILFEKLFSYSDCCMC